MTIPTSEPSRAYQRSSDGLWVFPRVEFCRTRFGYKAGQHAVFAGPSQNGKTTLAFDLLEYAEIPTPDLPAYVIVSKPTDPVSEVRGKRLGLRRVDDWPPQKELKELWGEKPCGFLIWPKFGDMDNDIQNAYDVTRRSLSDIYTKGAKRKKAILVLDDTYLKAKVLRLDREMTTIHAMAGAMGIGAFTFVQKATGAGETVLMAYGAAEHIFIFYEPDENYRKRYGEIGGVDPKLVERIVMSLKPFQALYIKRSGRHMCIVDKS